MRNPCRFVLRQVRARPLACFVAAFLLGLLLRRQLSVPTIACAVGFAAAAGGWFALRRRRSAAAALLLLAGLLCGMMRMGLALDALRPVETQYSVDLVGRVDAEPFTNPDTGRRIFRFQAETANGEPCDLTLRMYLRGEPEPLEAIEYGQRLRLTAHIWAADPVTNPYEFDFGAYLNRQGMDAYATGKIEDVEVVSASRDLRSAVIDIRHAIARRIDGLFPRSAGMMRALALGDRSLLGDEQRDALQRSGMAHLISISGLHVTLLAAVIALVLRRFMPRRIANLLAVALLIPYGALIGFTAPFVRALCSFAILCCASMAGLPSDGVTRLCAVMLAWLMARPLSVADAGFALSYSASAGILLLRAPLERLMGVEALKRRPSSLDRPPRWALRLALAIPESLCVSLAAQLATLPAVVEFFGGQPLFSVFFNLICVPLCMAGYLLGAAVLALSAILMPLAAALARVPDALLAWLTAITRFAGSIPVAYARIGRYPAALVLLHWVILLAASDISRLRPRFRRAMPLGLAGVACLASLLVFVRAWPFTIVFLDAGQADSAVIRSHGHTWLIDAGDTYTPAADYLNATCLKLDGVVLSHPHQDHAGGLTEVLDSFTPGVIYVPKGWFEAEDVSPAVTEGIDRARAMGVPVRELRAGDAVELSDAARMEIFSPEGDILPQEINDMSLLALVSCEGQRALFTGDLSREGEGDSIPDADVLKVAHHGSDKATSETFLAACTPEIAVISVGENNYGHPSEETLSNLAATSAEVLMTRERGAITLRWLGRKWRIQTYQEAAHEVE